MQTPPIEFDEPAIVRWILNPITNAQPMIDQHYSYAGQVFEARNCYWMFNDHPYGSLEDVKRAIEEYNAKLDQIVRARADS